LLKFEFWAAQNDSGPGCTKVTLVEARMKDIPVTKALAIAAKKANKTGLPSIKVLMT